MRNISLQQELDLILSRKLISGFIDNKKCIDWAISLMQRGYESEYLYILAGLDYYEWHSIEKYFDLLIEDLHLMRNENKEELFYLYASNIAHLVIENEIEPRRGLKTMEEIWLQTLDIDFSDMELVQFSYLAEDASLIGEYQIAYIGLTEENLNEVIVDEMKMFLQIKNKELYNISNLIYCNKCTSFTHSEYKENGWLFKRWGWHCKKCNSKEFLAWYNVADRKQIIKILENDEKAI